MVLAATRQFWVSWPAGHCRLHARQGLVPLRALYVPGTQGMHVGLSPVVDACPGGHAAQVVRPKQARVSDRGACESGQPQGAEQVRVRVWFPPHAGQAAQALQAEYSLMAPVRGQGWDCVRLALQVQSAVQVRLRSSRPPQMSEQAPQVLQGL